MMKNKVSPENKKSDLKTKNSPQNVQQKQQPFSSKSYLSFLQRTIGNRAVGRLLQTKSLNAGAFHNASNITQLLQSKIVQRQVEEDEELFQGVQTKLTIGKPNDIYEQEADRVADRIIQMQDSSVAMPMDTENIQEKPIAEMVTPLIQRNAEKKSSVVDEQTSAQIQTMKDQGSPLPDQTRAFMESRFGADFSDVRLHMDSRANEMSSRINAKAFTSGSDVYFNQGQYNVSSVSGKHLLAHELTHVVQQKSSTKRNIQKKIEVHPNKSLDTKGYTITKTGNVYSCPTVVKDTIWHELFTSLLHSPRVFKLKGTTNKEINKNFYKHQMARYGIINFASKKKYKFNVHEKRNPTYWKHGGPTGWELTTPPTGTSVEEWRKKAHADININYTEYEMACNQATRVTLEGGARAPFKSNTAGSDSDWIPGEAGYITNTGYVGGTSPAGTEGENIIYTGKDKFWGHLEQANTYRTLTEWFDKVKVWDGGAHTESDRHYPSNGIE